MMNSPARYNYDVELDLSPQSDVPPIQPPMTYSGIPSMVNMIPFPIKTDSPYYGQEMYREYSKQSAQQLYEKPEVYEYKQDMYRTDYKQEIYQYRQDMYPNPYRQDINGDLGYRPTSTGNMPYRQQVSGDLSYRQELKPIISNDNADLYKQSSQDMYRQYNGDTTFHQMYQQN
jgi:hypothetical protein